MRCTTRPKRCSTRSATCWSTGSTRRWGIRGGIRTATRSRSPRGTTSRTGRRRWPAWPRVRCFRVDRVSDEDSAALQYLASLGVRPGVVLRVLEREPFGGPLWVEAGGQRRAMGIAAGPSGAWRGAAVTATEAAARGQVTLQQVQARGRIRAAAGAAGPGVRGLGRLRRPGELRHQLRRRRRAWLRAGVGHRDGQPDGRPGAVPHLQGRAVHRPQPARTVPGPVRPPGQRDALAAGRDHRDGHRPRRVRRRRGRDQPALRRPAARGRPDHRGRRLRHPGPGTARLPALRAGDHRPAGAGRGRLRVPVLRRRRPAVRAARRRPGAAPGRRRHPRPDRRHHRRDRHAARGLPALSAAHQPGARSRAARTPHPAGLQQMGLHHRPGHRRAGQPVHAVHRRRACSTSRA